MNLDEYRIKGFSKILFYIENKNYFFLKISVFKGKETVDYIADYLKNIRNRRVFPDVIPGYIRELLPDSAPEMGENWDDIFKDVERVIMPGVCEILKNLFLYHKF